MSKVKEEGEAHIFLQSNTTPDLGHQMEKDIQERSNGNEFTGKPVWAANQHRHTPSNNESGKESITTPYPVHHMGKEYQGKRIMESDCRSNP